MPAPKKPMTGYFVFMQSIRKQVTEETGLKGIKAAPVISTKWKALTESERSDFNLPARKNIDEWKAVMAEYKKTDEYKEEQAAKIKKKFKRAPKDKNAPKKSLSAFFIYSGSVRKQVQLEVGGKNLGAVGKRLGAMWRELTDEDKIPFQEQAAEAKIEYKQKLEVYQQSEEYQQFQEEKTKFFIAKKKAMKRLSASM